MRVCGAARDMKMMNMFPFAPHLAFWQTHYAGTEFGVFMVGTGGGKAMGTEGNLRLLKKIKPDVVIGMPTFLYHVLTQAIAEGQELPNLKKLVLGGEKAPSGMRRKLRALAAQLGAPQVDVLSVYGFTEGKLTWAECPYQEDAGSAGFHVHPDLALIEIVDPKTGEPRGEGEPGEIVFTPLDARGSVVLRYRTGDCIDGGLYYEPCPYCGREVPRLMGELSRNSEIRELRIEKLKGTLDRLQLTSSTCSTTWSTSAPGRSSCASATTIRWSATRSFSTSKRPTTFPRPACARCWRAASSPSWKSIPTASSFTAWKSCG